MKRLIGITLIVFIFLVGFNLENVSTQADACASQNDIILRLSGTTNAHGEIYNGYGNYPNEICYSQLFIGQSPPATPDRNCGGGTLETVVTLSGDSNAHAEIPSENNYLTDICYQGLSCYSSTSGCGGDVEVVRLSADTNAHLELPPPLGPGNYGTSICCSIAAPPPSQGFSGLEWRDFANTQISSSNNVPICVGSWVKTYALAGGFSTGAFIEFDIFENDLLSDDYIRTVSGTIDINGNVEGNWEITQADYTTGSQGGEIGDLEFYFKVRPQGAATPNALSYDLQPVTDNPSQCSYTRPTGGITEPVHQGVYFVNDAINFASDCSSLYGPLTYSWEIEQNGVVVTRNVNTFQHTFTQHGQAIVKLTCTDISGQSISDEVGIIVASSPEILVYIEDPAHWGVEYTSPPVSGPYFPREVSFKGEETFAVVTFGLTGLFQGQSFEPYYNCVGYCLASSDSADGNCPYPYSHGRIPACQGLYGATLEGKIPIVKTTEFNQIFGPQGLPNIPVGHGGLNFAWKFWDNDWTYSVNPNPHQGNGYTSGFVEYDDRSEQFDDKRVQVTVTSNTINNELGNVINSYNSLTQFNPPYPNPIVEEFTRSFTLGRCLNGGNDFISDPTTHQTKNTLTSNNACKGGDSLAGTADDCCPDGLFCLDSTSNGIEDYRCQLLDGVVVTRCEDYSVENFGTVAAAQTACGANTNSEIAERSYGQTLGACEYVKCVWNPDPQNPTTGTCGVQLSQYPTTGNNGHCNPTPTGCNPAQCTWTVSTTECINGQQTITRTPIPGSAASAPICPPASGSTVNCINSEVLTVPCGNLGFELSFFDYTHFIVSALIIALIYAVLLSGRKNKE